MTEKVGSGEGGRDVPHGLSLCLVCVFDTQDSGPSSWQQHKARGPDPPGDSDPAPWLFPPHKPGLPKVWVGRQLGGDTSIEQRDLPYRQAGCTTGCWNRTSGQTGLCHPVVPPGPPWPSRGTQLPSQPQPSPHFSETVVGKGSSFPSSSTENITSPQLPSGGSVSCSG